MLLFCRVFEIGSNAGKLSCQNKNVTKTREEHTKNSSTTARVIQIMKTGRKSYDFSGHFSKELGKPLSVGVRANYRTHSRVP